MEVKDRLAAVIKSLEMKKMDFASSIGVSTGNLSDWLSDKKKSKPSIDALVRICEMHAVNMNWLLTGQGSMFIDPYPEALLETEDGRKKRLEMLKHTVKTIDGRPYNPSDNYFSRTVSLPVEAEIAAGPPVKAKKDSLAYIEIPRVFLSSDTVNYCVFRVNGHSMEPNIHHGDIVVIHYNYDWTSLDGKVCAIRTDDGITLKKVQLVPKHKQVLLLPFNKDYNVIVLDEDSPMDVHLVGVVVIQFRLY